MQRLLTSLLALASPGLCLAGYDEYRLLDFAICKQYVFTTNWGTAEFRSQTQQLEVEKARLDRLEPRRSTLYAMRDKDNANSPSGFAVCTSSDSAMLCIPASQFPYEKLYCPLGRSLFQPWARTCRSTPSSEIRIYWVDISEHEDGSKTRDNPYLESDLRRFRSRCRR